MQFFVEKKGPLFVLRALEEVVAICSVIDGMLKSLCTLSFLFSAAAAVTVKIEKCCVEFTEWIK